MMRISRTGNPSPLQTEMSAVGGIFLSTPPMKRYKGLECIHVLIVINRFETSDLYEMMKQLRMESIPLNGKTVQGWDAISH